MSTRIFTATLALLLCAGGAFADEPNAWQLLESGIAAHRRGDDKRALQCFEGALAKDPRCEDAYFYLGTMMEKAGDRRAAIGYLKKVSDKYPTYPLARGALGHIALKLEDRESAATYFEECANARASVDSWMQLATIQLDLKRYKEAEASLVAADKMTKKNYRLVELWARLYVESGRHDKAVDKYSEIVKQFPRDPIPLHMRGLCYLELDRKADALEDFRAVLKLDPFHTGAIHRLIALWKDDPGMRSDVADLEKRLEMIKKNPPKVRRVSGRG